MRQTRMSRSAQGMLFGRFGAIGAVGLLGGALDVDGAEARAFRLELEAPRERAEAAVEAIRPNDDVVPPAYSLTASSSSRTRVGRHHSSYAKWSINGRKLCQGRSGARGRHHALLVSPVVANKSQVLGV